MLCFSVFREATQPKGHTVEQQHPRLIMLTYFFSPFLAIRHAPLRRDISQPLNNKSDTLGTSLASILPFRQLNGPVMSSRSHDSRHDRAPVGAWLSLAWHRALLYKLPPGATLHSPQQPCLRSRLTYLQQYFLIQGRNGRAQIIIIMFSGCCRDDYVRYGAMVVPSQSLITKSTCESL